ncbi:formate hydrogenlyase subunit 3/multisubunit Na+/H+ antiporter MnhD subunit [Geothermobacter ehrlichii]|uniref:Formate hydrogenlyase subunit 3/multisubunit Na+/H+ antiporter MnhD subunit n=2 Tax=Geothermobacter ehrlichii TaxID=213224 RepID=A0A5D3WQM8_9BACT|nr:formate hydrogenlyase subunit 3/multisubunit Na+/H+ antiporter MnhD subunit [Geothermobacter ehrlichii]
MSYAYVAVVAALLSGLLPLLWPRNGMAVKMTAFPLLGISGLAGVISGVTALAGGKGGRDILPVGLPWLNCHLRLDALSGFFLAVVSLVALVAAIYGPAYVREYEEGPQPLLPLTLFTGLFVAGMDIVLLAADAFSFMIGWEMMSVTSYFLVAYQHQHEVNRQAAFIYLLMAQVGGLFILLGYGVLAGFGQGFDFTHMARAQLSDGWSTVAFLLAFIGFGMKAGVVPLHVWLPQAHPVAPSHVSALMSGVMLKVAVYGFIRFTYHLLGGIHWQWGALALFVGSSSAVLGVLYALMQHDLKRLLAYHSVENIGIIYIGLGLSMIFAGTGHPALAALGLVAALYHCLNHALFKSLLFFGAGVILQQSHEHDLEKMGGLIRRLPVTATCFLIGCISISALPPFNGFVSEWLTFQTALQGPVLTNNILAALIPVAAAVLALTGALAAACFVKVYGVCFLGLPRSENCASARETGQGPLLGQILLALLCLFFGVLPSWTVGRLEHVARLFFPGGMPETTAHGWLWLTPVAPHVASYGAPMVLLGVGLAWLLSWLWVHPRRRKTPVRIGSAWDCGFGPLNARMQYTATAFTMPIRRIFRPVWPIEESFQESATGSPGGRYRLKIGDWAWLKFYEPIGRLLLAGARRLAMIQGGNIRTYLAYSFFTLLVLLLVVSL